MCQPFICARKYCTKRNCHNLHNHTYARFTRQNNIYELVWVNSEIYFIKLYLPWSNHNQVESNINSKFLWLHTCWTFYPFTKRMNYFQSLLVILKVLLNIFQWNVPTLACNRYISIHVNSLVSYHLFPRSLKVLINWRRWGSVRVYDSISSTRDSFRKYRMIFPV